MFIYFRPIYFEMLNNLTTSIVIRALNEQLHIGKLLYGIQQQTKLPDEIILVDSGSTDDTLLIASSYEVQRKNFKARFYIWKSFKYWL